MNGILVWEDGFVIDTSTGEVVDRIYDYGPLREKWETREYLSLKLRGRSELERGMKKLKRRLRRLVSLYNQAKKLEEAGFSVDYSRLKKHNYVDDPYGALENFKKMLEEETLQLLDKIIESLKNKEPTAFMRTLRARYVLAHMILTLARGGKIKHTSYEFTVSRTTYNRLSHIARKIYKKHKQLINQILQPT